MLRRRGRQPALLVTIAAFMVLLVGAWAQAQTAAPSGEQQLINIDVKDAPIEQVLRMLAKAASVNILIGPDVKGTVEAISLRDVTVDAALRLIATSQRLYWYKQDNVYIVSKDPPPATVVVPSGPSNAGGTPTGPAGGGTTMVPMPGAVAGNTGEAPLTQGAPRTTNVASAPPPLVGPNYTAPTGGAVAGEPKFSTAMITLAFADAGQLATMFGGTICSGGSPNEVFGSQVSPFARHKAQQGLSRGSRGLSGNDVFGGTTGSAGALGQEVGGGFGGGGGGRGGGRLGGGGGLGGQQSGGLGGQQSGGRGGLGGGGTSGGGGGAGALAALLPPDMDPPIGFMPENALLVRGSQEDIDKFREIIELLDKPTKQVEIAAKFINVQTTADKALGIDWSISNGTLEFFNQGFAPGEAVNNVVRFARGRFEAQLNALLASGRATVVNEPHVIAMNNQFAEINFSTTIPYFTAQISYNQFGQRTVDFTNDEIDVENSLWVVPRINADDSITVYLEPTLDDVVGNVVGPNGESVPVVTSQYVSTTVRVADGETVVLGGLIRKDESSSLRETPLLSRIPIIGRLFQGRSTRKSNSELLVFVTPRIIRDIPPQ